MMYTVMMHKRREGDNRDRYRGGNDMIDEITSETNLKR